MNLAILIGRFPPGPVGGAEFQAERWAQLLGDRHRVVVVTRRDPGQPDRETRDGFEVVRLPVSPLPLWRTWHDLRGIERAVSHLSPRPDLLLCFQTFISGLAGVWIQSRSGIPAVVWVRGDDEIRLDDPGITRWVSPGVWRRARGVLTQSDAVRTELLARLAARDARASQLLAGKLEVVPNGIDLPGPPLPAGRGILAVGRLIPQKGMDVVIDAVAPTSLSLTIAGDGPERSRLEARARPFGDRIRFEGSVPRDRLDRLYRDACCVVLASRRGEGLPNVLLEGMSYGRPIVATPVAGVRDLVHDGENGLLIPPDDPVALRAALSRLAADPALATRLGAAGRITAERFRWESVRRDLEPLLERWAS